jgi:hypothetical protein
MARAWILITSTMTSGALVGLVACTTDYQKGLDDPNYGGPNALADQVPPGPSVVQTTGSSGNGAAKTLCETQGGTLVTPTCAAGSTFADVLKALNAGGCGAASCHGGAKPANQPEIDPTDATGSWASMAAFQLNTRPFINPCSTDPTKSGLPYNVDKTAAEGDRGTLMPQGGAGLPDAIPILKAYATCGSAKP